MQFVGREPARSLIDDHVATRDQVHGLPVVHNFVTLKSDVLIVDLDIARPYAELLLLLAVLLIRRHSKGPVLDRFLLRWSLLGQTENGTHDHKTDNDKKALHGEGELDQLPTPRPNLRPPLIGHRHPVGGLRI